MRLLFLLWGGYAIFMIYTIIRYFKIREVSANLSITNAFYAKQIGVAAIILSISILLYLFKKPLWAKWVAGIPALIAAVVVGIGVIVWIGYAIIHTLENSK